MTPFLKLIHKIEKDEKNFQLDRSDDVFVVASLLKVRYSFTKVSLFTD